MKNFKILVATPKIKIKTAKPLTDQHLVLINFIDMIPEITAYHVANTWTRTYANTQINIKETECDDMDWIQLADIYMQ